MFPLLESKDKKDQCTIKHLMLNGADSDSQFALGDGLPHTNPGRFGILLHIPIPHVQIGFSVIRAADFFFALPLATHVL